MIKVQFYTFVLFYYFTTTTTFAQNLDGFGAKEIRSDNGFELNQFRNLKSEAGNEISVKIIEVTSKVIVAELTNGKRIEIPIEKLSYTDQEMFMKYLHEVEDPNSINFSEERIWQSKDGKVLKGAIHRLETSSVFIKRNDGRIVPVPLKILSQKDVEVLKIYESQKSLIDNDDLKYLLGLYKWRDRTDKDWSLQLEFSKAPSTDGRQVLSIVHRNYDDTIKKIQGSWSLLGNGIVATSGGNGTDDVHWKCPKSKKDRKALVAEIIGVYNYYGLYTSSNIILVPDK